MKYFKHESSYIDDNVSIGEGTKNMAFFSYTKWSYDWKECSIGQNVNISNNVQIGNHVKIQNNVSIYEGVEIEGLCFLWDLPWYSRMISILEVNIQKGAVII